MAAPPLYRTPWVQHLGVTMEADGGTETSLAPLLPRLPRKGAYPTGLFNPAHDEVFYLMVQINHKLQLQPDHVILLLDGIQLDTFAQMVHKYSVFSELRSPLFWLASASDLSSCE